jgi:hypothetical protein
MPSYKTNRWHPVLLPDNYPRKMKQDLAEADAMVESKTRREGVLDDRPAYDFDQTPPDDGPESHSRQCAIDHDRA